MEVILKSDVENLGLAYDIVEVKPGYARNFLIPAGAAKLATKEAVAERNQLLEEKAAEEAAVIKEAQTKIEALKGVDLKIKAKTGEKDKLFGSINNADVAEGLSSNGVSIDKKYIKIPGNTIKRTGAYTAKVRLHREVETDFNFEIVAEEA